MVQRYINDYKHLTIQSNRLKRPFLPHHISLFSHCHQGCRNIYNKVKTKEVECRYRAKWNNDLDIHIDNKTWRRVFYLIFNVEQDNNFIWFQYKLIHEYLVQTVNCIKCPLRNQTNVDFVNQILKHLCISL